MRLACFNWNYSNGIIWAWKYVCYYVQRSRLIISIVAVNDYYFSNFYLWHLVFGFHIMTFSQNNVFAIGAALLHCIFDYT